VAVIVDLAPVAVTAVDARVAVIAATVVATVETAADALMVPPKLTSTN
jgi:hypothetical protein